VVKEFLKTVEPRLEKENISLDCRLESGKAIPLDRRKMARVLHNVVGNALEAMEPGGKLTVEVTSRDQGMLLAISDTGCGMDAGIAARVCEPFFSHGKDRGVGLGMAIVGRIMEQHGAALSIHSDKGQGTRVEFLFPVLPRLASAR
jgi:signal transduction histidine kinase